MPPLGPICARLSVFPAGSEKVPKSGFENASPSSGGQYRPTPAPVADPGRGRRNRPKSRCGDLVTRGRLGAGRGWSMPKRAPSRPRIVQIQPSITNTWILFITYWTGLGRFRGAGLVDAQTSPTGSADSAHFARPAQPQSAKSRLI